MGFALTNLNNDQDPKPALAATHPAVVDGDTLTLTYDRTLHAGKAPPASNFSVSGTAETTTVEAVAISGKAVLLTLSPPVGFSDTGITVSYVKTDPPRTQNLWGIQADAFSSQSVTNNTPAPRAESAPTGVTVSAGSNSGSLEVSWTAPSGTITDYDLRYYEGRADPADEADWVEEDETTGLPAPGTPHTTTSATIKGLTAATAYRVQVRGSTTAGGEGAWSASASGTTGAVSTDNNAPKAMAHQSGANRCKEWTDKTQPADSTDATAGSLVSLLLITRGTETTQWPASCTAEGNTDAPVFDDRDAEALTVTMTSLTLPDNVRGIGGNAPVFFSDGTDRSNRLFARALAIGGETHVRVDLTAADPHGATVSAWVRFIVRAFPGASAPQFSAQVSDQSATRGEAFSLTLPAATGGDTTVFSTAINSPYVYAVSGLPAGLSFDPETRTISGAPTQTGSFTVTYTADDADHKYSLKASPTAEDLADAATQTFTISMTRPASAKLVGNTGQAHGTPTAMSLDLAQPFTTGDNGAGYRLTRVDLPLKHNPNPGNIPGPNISDYSVSIHRDSAGRPGRSLGTLQNPSSTIGTSWSQHQFTASGGGIQLSANSTYLVVVDNYHNHYRSQVRSTDSDAEDSGAASGWSIGNSHTYVAYGSSWGEATTDDRAIKINIHGYAKSAAGPTLNGATVDGTTLTLNYDRALNENSTPAPGDFAVIGAGPEQIPTGVVVSGSAVTLTLERGATAGETVTVFYTEGGRPIADALGNTADHLNNRLAANVTGASAPTVQSVSVASTPTVDADSDGTPDTYGLGGKIRVRVDFSAPVTVTGTPRLKIKFATGVERWAEYDGGDGTTALTFGYTVAAQDASTDGVAVVENTLELNDGTIAALGNPVAADLSHTGLDHDAAHKVDSSQTPTDPPGGAPTGVSVSAGTTNGRLDVSWTAPSGTIEHYELRYYAGSSDPTDAADWVERGESTGLPQPTSTSGTINGLKKNTQYRVQVRAVNFGGESQWSASASGATGNAAATNNAPVFVRWVRADAFGPDKGCEIVSTHSDTKTTYSGAFNTTPVLESSEPAGEFPQSCASDNSSAFHPPIHDPDGNSATNPLTLSIDATLPENVRSYGEFQGASTPVVYALDGTVRIAALLVSAHRKTEVPVTVTATDPHGASVSFVLTYEVFSFNGASAPQFAQGVTNQFAKRGETFSLVLPPATGGDVTFKNELGTDVVTFPYRYSVSDLPPGLSFDAPTRTIGGTPTQDGNFVVTYTADDADGDSANLNPDASAPGDTARLTFEIRVGAPTIELVRIVSASTYDSDGNGRNDTYVKDDVILVDVEFSEPVRIVDDGDDIRLRLDLGTDDSTPGNSRKTLLNPTVVNRGLTLRFKYTVTASDTDADGVWVQTNADDRVLFMPGEVGKVLSVASGIPAGHTLAGLPTAGGEFQKVDGSKTAADTGPRPTGATVNGSGLTVNFNRTLSAADLAALAFQFSVQGAGDLEGGIRNVYQHPSTVAVTGANNRNVQMTLSFPARGGDTVTVTYKLHREDDTIPNPNDPTSRIPNPNDADLKDSGGKKAPAFIEFKVTNNTPGGVKRPVPLSASVTDERLEIVFDEALNETSTPAGSSFLVHTSDAADDHREIRGTGTTTVSGNTVSVKLAWEVRVDEIATVSYARPDYAPLQSAAGVDVLAFDRFKVGRVYDGKKPQHVEQAAMQTRSSPAQSKIVLYFDEDLDAGSVPAAGDFNISAPNVNNPIPTPSVAVVGSAVVLTLDMAMPGEKAYTVFYTPGTNRIRDLAGNTAESFRAPAVSEGAETPMLVVSRASGVAVRLLFRQFLSPEAPPVDAFKIHLPLLEGQTDADLIEYGGIAGVTPRAKVFGLILKHPVYPCDGYQPFTLTYTKPTAAGTHPLQGIAGGEVAEFAKRLVTNTRHDECSNGGVSGQSGAQSNSGKSLNLKFQNPLDTGWSLKKSAFTVKGKAGASAPVVQGASYTSDGSGVALLLGRALAPGETVDVGYSRPANEPGLWDTDGQQIADFSGVEVVGRDAPVVTGVEVVSDAGDDDTYRLGDVVRVRLTFSEAVDVEGTPRLGIDMDPAQWGQKWAGYESGSGTTELTFAYTVVEPNESTQGIAVLADTLELDGGVIASVSEEANAYLPHDGLEHDPSHKVDWRLAPDTTAPALAAASVDGRTLTLTFDEPLAAVDTGALPFAFLVDGIIANGSVSPGRVAIDGATVTLHLGTGAAPGQTVTVTYFAAAAGNALRDAAGNPVAGFDGAAVENGPRAPAPTVTGVSVVSDPGDDDTYGLDDVIRVQVTFSEAVDVTGNPRLQIDMDPADWGGKWAVYESGSSSSALTFAYTVVQPNQSTQGIAVLADTLELNGGAIESADSNADADLSHDGLSHDPQHKVDATPPAPTVSAVAVVSDPGDDDTYGLGDVIRIRVTFDEAVDVTGTPRVTFDMDPAHWGEKWARYESGTGTAALVFAYTVVEPNESTQGIAVLADSLARAGGTIRSAASGANAALSHEGLGHDPAHKVDSTPPAPTVAAVAVVSDPGDDDTYGLGDVIRVTLTFSEAVNVTGSPRLKIDMDSADWGEKWAVYESGSGTTALTFAHTVVEPNESTQGIAVLENTLELDGGTIGSAATQASADRSHSGLAHDANHKVDWRN